MKHCIAVELDQWSEARGICDIVFTRCRMTSGRSKTFEDGDPEVEEFFRDRDAYWKKRGWKRVLVKGGWTLRPHGQSAASERQGGRS